MRDIIMTVKPRHIRNMQKGLKGYELRHTRPVQAPVGRVWICEKGSGGRIVASFKIGMIEDMTADGDTIIAELCAITPEEVAGYRKKGGRLYGWLIKDFMYFNGPENDRHILDFGLKRPPQSWCYAKQKCN